ncbi:MAG: ABC transporter ATP-binding protein [Candidatus Gracilibacteria bacterium]
MNAISVKHLTKVYATGTKALKGVDLEVKEGDFFGLLGANGAGKTTIIGILTSLVNKTSGKAKIFDFDLDTDMNRAKRQVGVVPQEFNFSIFEKVIDIVVAQGGYFGVPRAVAMDRAEKILTALELWHKKDMPSRTLSGGMKRRLMIARALIHEPRLLFLDEPTAGVDVELRHGMWKYLNELNAKGTTIFLTTHYLEEAEQLCRNVAIIKEGEIVRNDAVKKLIGSLEKQTYILTVESTDHHKKVRGYELRFIDDVTMEADLHNEQTMSGFIHDLHEHGYVVRDIRPKGNRLEQLFLNILQNK